MKKLIKSKVFKIQRGKYFGGYRIQELREDFRWITMMHERFEEITGVRLKNGDSRKFRLVEVEK